MKNSQKPQNEANSSKVQTSTQNSHSEHPTQTSKEFKSDDNTIKAQIISIIDSLKATCASYGLGNDGNEYKIILSIFLYKFLNDKFAYEAKNADPTLQKAGINFEQILASYSQKDYQTLLYKIGEKAAHLKREHFLSSLFLRQNEDGFATILDKTLLDIAELNKDIFAIKTGSGERVQLFEAISNYIVDFSKRDNFAKALINPLINFNFEAIFSKKFDFFATIFEYLIKDYNKDGGGKYAEYYTPQNVAKIMSSILVGTDKPKSVKCYDPSAGSGSLLMSLAHAIGEDKCSIYSQDLSQKSSTMLRLNLILNNLTHSIANIIQGNTLTSPAHTQKFDYIVSNPPFKLDFSDFSATLLALPNANERFFAGIPKVPSKDKDKMAIYLCFIQHIIYSLNDKGRAAVVVPTGFLTAQSGIERAIRQRLVDTKALKGVISMPSNIFATTGTNVSVLFIDKSNAHSSDEAKAVLLMDASKLGEKIKEGKNQKTRLSKDEENKIISAFLATQNEEDFCVCVSFKDIKEKNYSFSAGQFFEVKLEFKELSEAEFNLQMKEFTDELSNLFKKAETLQKEILRNLGDLRMGG